MAPSRSPRGRLPGVRAFIVACLASLSFVQCDDEACEPGEPCVCRSGEECYLECEDGGCDQECSAHRLCGNVCGDRCRFRCHSTNDCSSFCDAGCDIECHDTNLCGAICGAGCSYDCHNATECGARVGPNSTVRCADVSSCVVECEGSCRVICSRVGGGCAVSCGTGAGPVPCPDGTPDCVACAG